MASIEVFLENNETGQTITFQLPTDGVLYTFANKNSSEAPLLDMENVLVTHIRHDAEQYIIGTSGGGGMGTSTHSGQIEAFSPDNSVVDVANWTILANFKG
jgi:hypothetical protein